MAEKYYEKRLAMQNQPKKVRKKYKRKKVKIDDIIYDNIDHAVTELNLTYNIVFKRITSKNDKYKNYVYIE